MFRTYRSKLIIAFVLIAVIPIFIIGISMNLKLRDQVSKEVIKIEKVRMSHEIEKLEMWFDDKETILKSISTNYPLLEDIMKNSDSFYEVSKYLKSHINSEDSFLNIYITTIDGREYNSQFAKVKQDTRLRDWFVKAYESKDISWTQPYKDILTNEIVVTVSIPLLDSYNNVKAVLGADVNFERLISKFKLLKIHDEATIYIINSKEEIAKVTGEDIFGSENISKSEIEELTSKIENDEIGEMTLELNTDYFGIYGTIKSIDWNIISLVDKIHFFSSVTTMRKSVLVTFIIAIILVIIVSILFSKIFSKALERLKEGTLELQRGNYDYRIKVDRNDEFGHLSKAFNNMASNLKRTYEKLTNTTKELSENNNQLQEMNIELEASYEQLQATTEQLNESESKYRTLIENMYDLVWVIDIDYKFIFVNNQVEKMLKFRKKDIIGKDIRNTNFIREDKNNSMYLNKVKNEDLKNQIIKFTSKHKEAIILELNTKRIYENGKLICIQGVARDVTKRILMEKEIIKRNKELSIINGIGISLNSALSLDNLLENAVHDITRIMDISLCTIRLLGKNNKLKRMGCAGELSEFVTEEYIDIDKDIMGKVVRTGEVIEFSREDEEYITPFNNKVLNSGRVNFSTVFPLKARDKILGVLVVSTKEKLDKSSWNILSSLSNQLTIKIDNIKLYNDLKTSYMKTIKTLAAAVEAKDKYTEGHSLRVAKYAVKISQRLNLSKEFCEEIEVAGILHDIGKIGVKDKILVKPGRLTDEEFKSITEHPMIGNKILKDVGLSKNIMDSIKYHHKRYDLKGYPYDDEIEELPLGASIIGVADAFDAMTSNRSYRYAMSFREAIDELISSKGTQFSPDIVDIIVEIFNENSQGLLEVAVTDKSS